MRDIFSDMVDICIIIYLDNILIFSDTPELHRSQVREVLRRLRKNGLFAGAPKCIFNVTTVEYLGYILSPTGLSMDSVKVRTIQDWPEPRKVKDVQSFLCFANFYCRFIHNYSDIVVLLTREIHPVAFHSHTLSTPELNYDTHNKELLAIFEA